MRSVDSLRRDTTKAFQRRASDTKLVHLGIYLLACLSKSNVYMHGLDHPVSSDIERIVKLLRYTEIKMTCLRDKGSHAWA